jgi:hypothetical protein
VECPNCKRNLSVKKSTCLYCGASLEGAFSNHKSRIDIQGKDAVVVDEKRTKVELTGLNPSDLQKIKDAIGEGKNAVIEKDQTQIQEFSSDWKDDTPIALSFEKLIAVIDKMKATYNDGQIEYSNYKQMVVEMVKDYISTLDNSVKIHFVVNEISASELAEYLDDEMLKDLRAFVISSVSDK